MKIMVFWDMTPCILLDKYQDPAASTFQAWKFYLEDEGTSYEMAWYHIPEVHLVVVPTSWVKDVLLCHNGVTFCITEYITLQHMKPHVQKSAVEISSNDSAPVIKWIMTCK
jgi:hypothetical protein